MRATEAAYRRTSLWMETVPGALGPRPALDGDLEVDVAVVGGGYTGLWTSYYLSEADPSLRIAVLDKDIAGFGASGRNGGWCSADFPASFAKVARTYGTPAALAMQAALNETVDEVGAVAGREGIDCHYAKGGSLAIARTPTQLARARAEVEDAVRHGLPDGHVELLDGPAARARLDAQGVLGATYTPHCAVLHPARLVRGLAEVVEARGVRIYEGTAATAVEPHLVRTERGVVRAGHVVRATEGYTRSLAGQRRALAPVYSLVLATEPLADAVWQRIGLGGRETFTDHGHLIVYGQRTADDRLVFGGRGAPYHFGSRVLPAFDRDPRVFAALRRTLVELFPVLSRTAITHTWGGPLGVPRDWFPSVGLDAASGLGWAGGYVGDGVAASHLAGRTLADLITGARTPRTRLPWVGHRSPEWEPEPLRWLGVNLGLTVMASADAREERTGRASRRAAAVGRLLGH